MPDCMSPLILMYDFAISMDIYYELSEYPYCMSDCVTIDCYGDHLFPISIYYELSEYPYCICLTVLTIDSYRDHLFAISM